MLIVILSSTSSPIIAFYTIVLVKIGFLSLSGKACLACSAGAHLLEWWGSSNGCMLGSLLPFGRPKWKNSSCNWNRSLPSACGASAVSYSALCCLHSSYCIYLMPSYLLCVLISSGKLTGDFIYVYVLYFTFSIVVQFGLTKISFGRHPSPTVLIPALRTVGNIVTGDDAQTQV